MGFPLLAAGIGAAGSLLGNIFGNTGARRRQDRANKQNIKFWNMQNAYNSPTSQMERLREAGLNPNLIYGQGAKGATGQSERIAPSKAPEFKISNPLQNITQFADVNVKKAQVDNLKAQTTNAEQETILKAAQTAGIGIKTKRDKFGLNLDTALLNTSMQAATANVRKMEAQSIQIELDNSIKSESKKAIVKDLYYKGENAKATLKGTEFQNVLKELEVQLKQIGIERNDPWYFRIIGRHWDKIKQIKLKHKPVLKN